VRVAPLDHEEVGRLAGVHLTTGNDRTRCCRWCGFKPSKRAQSLACRMGGLTAFDRAPEKNWRKKVMLR
jgi:hypothetical protein